MRRWTVGALLGLGACGQGPNCDAAHLPECKAACTAGSAPACATYADAEWSGNTPTVGDPAALKQVLEQSCALDDGHGCQLLGQAVHQGYFGLAQDDARAMELWVKACDRKSAAGCRWLGWAYQSGWAVTENPEKAREHLQQACVLGERYGCSEQGWALISLGRPDEALPLWQKGCDAKDGESCRGVAWSYANGSGVPKDEVMARKIAEQGCGYEGTRWSCGLLGWYLIEGTGGDRDVARGRDLMRQGCDGGFAWACTTLESYGTAPSPFVNGG